ncbi:hypothetical protein BCR44DRAFT_26979 [Catenaria anguillulae PL171]|uniref:Uncharacterized protein n=1 Tax=Catenaria anguillulae PL171 TaxID=765915 RepID=A0A1Y2HG42_9FUNG|nr:hypothetical protein BCR44DRAFT_26979 [Catenaria anguillulae PL171]
MTVGLSSSSPSAMNQHESINPDTRAAKERTPFDRAVEIAAATYARYNAMVATWFPPVQALLSIASLFCMYTVGLAVYFDHISNIPLFSLDRLQQSSVPYVGANWFCVGILSAMTAWVFAGTGVFLHQPTWTSQYGKRVFVGLAFLVHNLLNALGSSCGSLQVPLLNEPTTPPVCTTRVLPSNRSPVWEVFGYNSAGTSRLHFERHSFEATSDPFNLEPLDGCSAIRAVDTKKILLYIYLAISAWTLHVSVTAITHLHHHFFDTATADTTDIDVKPGEKGQVMVTTEVASTVIADSP